MPHAIGSREKNAIIGGAIFLIAFLLIWFALLPKRHSLNELKASVRAMTDELEEIGKIESQYNRLKIETDPVMNRIQQRRKDFNISSFVMETENRLNFSRTREIPARPTTYGNFEKRGATYIYSDKSLRQIMEFIGEIEKPENVVGIESLRITPKSTTQRSQLELYIKLFTVVQAE
jgi:hypothetical protein